MNVTDSDWIRKRFLYFRFGTNYYLAFSVVVLNFVLIIYRFVIETSPSLKEIFDNLVYFIVIFLIVYIPLAIYIGFRHFKDQQKIESTYQFMQSPGIIKAFKLILELQTDTADKNDVDAFKKLLKNLEKKSMVRICETIHLQPMKRRGFRSKSFL